MADDDDNDYKDLQWLHLFVLDVSSWSGTRDQSFSADYVTDFGSDDDESPFPPSPRPPPSPSSFGPKSRLEAQVACMKLIACARQPRQVGVVHMGGYTSRVKVNVEPTENWRVKQNAESKLEEEEVKEEAKDGVAAAVLVDYAPISEPQESSVACPDPRRIVVALRKCKEILQDIFSEKRECNARGSVVITLFLSSPPKGFTLVESDLRAVLREVTGMPHNACMQLVLHPQVFSTEHLDRFGSGVWSSYDTKSDFAPETRCSQQDMDTIERCFGVCLRHDIPDPNILYTVCQNNNYYLSPWCREKVSMYGRWKECYEPGGDFPQLLWSCEWLPISFENWLGRQTGAIAEELGRATEDLPGERTTSEFTEEQVKKIERLTSMGIPEEAAKKCAAADADDYEVVPTKPCILYCACNLKEGGDVEEVRKCLKAYCSSGRASKGVIHNGYTEKDGIFYGIEIYNSPDACEISMGNCFPHFVEALPHLDMGSMTIQAACDPTEVECYTKCLAIWGGNLSVIGRPCEELLAEEHTTVNLSPAAFAEACAKKIKRLTDLGISKEVAKKSADADADDYEVVPTKPCACYSRINLKKGADVDEVRECLKAYSFSANSSKGMILGDYILGDGYIYNMEVWNSPDALDIAEGNALPHFISAQPHLDMESFEMKVVCDPTEVEYYTKRLAIWGAKLTVGPSH